MNLVIFGAGGHGKVILDILKRNNIEITGFLDDDKSKANTEFQNYPILGDLQYCGSEESILGDKFQGIVAIGDNKEREKVLTKLLNFGMVPYNAFHPKATIADDVTFGKGNAVMAGVIINPGSKIGNNVIINTACSIDHDNILEDHVQVCPGSHLAGEVTVKKYAFIGTGAIVNPGIKIGFNSIIGSGAVIIKDIPDNVVVAGNPSKIIKKLV
jgi:UDP-perosamine 4-acetyltransferase